jgi:hypothetical protein
MQPFAKALETIAGVMRDGVATHPDGDWVRRSVDYHLARAELHLHLLRDGDQAEDHLVLLRQVNVMSFCRQAGQVPNI